MDLGGRSRGRRQLRKQPRGKMKPLGCRLPTRGSDGRDDLCHHFVPCVVAARS